jgi:hypothetical protein
VWPRRLPSKFFQNSAAAEWWGVVNSKPKHAAMTLAQQLREDGLQQGMQQGVQQGMQQGMQQAMRQGILQTLQLRFKRVPAGLREEIELMGDIAKLQSLHRAAILSGSIEEFAGAL